MKMKKGNFICVSAMLSAALALGGGTLAYANTATASGATATPEKSVTTAAAAISADETVSIKLSFAGDCTLGSDLSYGKKASFMEVFEKQKNPYDYFFKNVKEVFKNDDLSIVNLEGTFTTSNSKADKTFAFKGLPQFAKILGKGNIEVANLSNNHTKDYGQKGYEDTVKNLSAEGIASFGVNKPYIKEIKGVKVGLLGYGAWSSDAYMKKKIANDIAELKAKDVKIIVASFHGGEEYSYYPNSIQKSLATYAVDQGADLVIGHHSHVMQGIAVYKGKNIVYSLGNFCFGGNRNPSDKDTFIYQHTFKLDKSTLKKTGDSGKIIPCSISSAKTGNNFQPVLLTGSDAERVKQRLRKYSAALNAKVDFMSKMY